MGVEKACTHRQAVQVYGFRTRCRKLRPYCRNPVVFQQNITLEWFPARPIIDFPIF